MNPQEIPNTAQPPPLEAPLPEKLDLKSLFEALLLRPHALVARLAEPNHGATGRFAIMAVVSILLFGFMGSLAIGAWVVAVAFALRFLRSVIFATGGTQKAPLTIWSIVFRLVTLQMTTSLRPILGRSDVRLTQEKKFFLQHWGDTFGTSLKPQTAAKPAPEKPADPASTPGGRNPYIEN